jgi:hypothetical protein
MTFLELLIDPQKHVYLYLGGLVSRFSACEYIINLVNKHFS